MDLALLKLNQATLCSAILSLKMDLGHKLFMSVDLSWNGNGYYTFVFPQKYASQAKDSVKFLLKYLSQFHGDKVFHWFMSEAVAEAHKMGWNGKKQHPILQEGIELYDLLLALELE